jgi:streptogrisin C
MIRATVKAVAVAGIATIGLGTASAGAADDGTNPLAAGTAAYQAAYPQLSAAQARAAAAGSDARRAVYDAVAADTGTFGGAWFDPLDGVVNVAVTTSAAGTRAATVGKRYGVDVKPYRVARTAAALEAEANRLRARKDAVGQAADGNVGIDVKTNEVVAAVPQARRSELSKSAPAGTKVIPEPAQKVVPDAGCTTRAACDWTIRAGAIMWRDAAMTPWCSVGFTARNASNTRFVYTAGHCATGNGVPWGTGAQGIGPMSASMDSGVVDASVIQVTNSWFTGDSGGEIYMQGGAFTMPLKGVAPTVGYMVAGETVCLAANFTQPSYSGNLCGVLGTNSDASVRGMARVDGLDACGGDSGGGWYWLSSSGNRYAYGIHSRSDGGCHGDAGGTHSWYTPIASAKSLFQPTLDVEIRP